MCSVLTGILNNIKDKTLGSTQSSLYCWSQHGHSCIIQENIFYIILFLDFGRTCACALVRTSHDLSLNLWFSISLYRWADTFCGDIFQLWCFLLDSSIFSSVLAQHFKGQIPTPACLRLQNSYWNYLVKLTSASLFPVSNMDLYWHIFKKLKQSNGSGLLVINVLTER